MQYSAISIIGNLRHVNRNDLIIADSADAKSINMLQRYFNIIPTNKKKIPVAEALKMMQDYEIVVTEGSRNLAKELDNYIWHDKKSGVPIGTLNHLIDGMRYYFMNSVNIRREYHQIWHI